jgi:hypothetical protein
MKKRAIKAAVKTKTKPPSSSKDSESDDVITTRKHSINMVKKKSLQSYVSSEQDKHYTRHEAKRQASRH